MASVTWDKSRQTVFDGNGRIAPGAKAYFYEAGTTTARVVYSDASLSTPHTQPVETDSAGRWPRVFLDYGTHRERVTTRSGAVLWDDDNIENEAPATPAETTVSEDAVFQTGDFLYSSRTGPRTGWVRANGGTIGSASSGATERANADTYDLYVHRWNTMPDSVAPVTGGRGATAAADFAANKAMVLADLHGRSFIGATTMGGTASTILSAITFTTGSSDQVGSTCGVATHALTSDQMPSHTHTATATVTDPGHSHSENSTSGTTTGGGAFPASNSALGTTGTAVTGISVAVSNANTGGGSAHPNVQPSVVATCYYKL